MATVLLIGQMMMAVLLIGAILLQAQGTGLGASWSGGGESYHTRRGLEKILFIFTIVGTAVFAGLSIANIVIR